MTSASFPDASYDGAGPIADASRGQRAAQTSPSTLLQVILLTLLLFGVGAANGRPSVFFDTNSYYTQGEYLATRLHLAPPPSAERLADPRTMMPEVIGREGNMTVTSAAARSPFYGLFLFMTHAIGSLWLLAFIQALAAAWVVCLALRVTQVAASPLGAVALIAILGLGTSLPFFAAFAMPDIFVGVGMIATIVLLVFPQRLSRPEYIGLLALVAVSAAFHKSCLATLLALILAGAATLLVLRFRAGQVATRAGALAMALAAAVLASAAFDSLYRHDTGLSQSSPPFLIARVLADGPGRAYLRAFCPGGASPTLCPYKSQKYISENEVLWSPDPAVGIYSLTDFKTRHRLKREELGFVLAAIAYDPITELRASALNFVKQLGMFWVDDPLRNPMIWQHNVVERKTAHKILAPDLKDCFGDETRCDARASKIPLAIYHGVILVVALGVLLVGIVIAVRRKRATGMAAVDEDGRLVAIAAGLLVLGVIINAGVSGILVGPFPRYEARLVWLIPMAAFLVAAEAWRVKAWRLPAASPATVGARRP